MVRVSENLCIYITHSIGIFSESCGIRERLRLAKVRVPFLGDKIAFSNAR